MFTNQASTEHFLGGTKMQLVFINNSTSLYLLIGAHICVVNRNYTQWLKAQQSYMKVAILNLLKEIPQKFYPNTFLDLLLIYSIYAIFGVGQISKR